MGIFNRVKNVTPNKNEAGGSQQLSKDENDNWICPKCGKSSKHLAKLSSIDDLGCFDCYVKFYGWSSDSLQIKMARKMFGL